MLINYDRINPHAPGNVQVEDASTVVLTDNVNRRYAVFTNDSDAVIYLAFADTAVAHQGIRLNANGGSYEIDFKNFYVGSVSAIHEATGEKKNLCVQEG